MGFLAQQCANAPTRLFSSAPAMPLAKVLGTGRTGASERLKCAAPRRVGLAVRLIPNQIFGCEEVLMFTDEFLQGTSGNLLSQRT